MTDLMKSSVPHQLSTPVLQVDELVVDYQTSSGTSTAVNGVSLAIERGEVVAIVGESGSGKSTTAHAIVGLLPSGGRLRSGRIALDGIDISGWSDRRLRAVRGAQIGLVPQDPTVSLDPVRRIGRQVADTLRVHGRATRRSAPADALDILTRAGLPDPVVQARQYPHQLSGGMRQRVLIGMALACRPQLVIADEPTSALDVTVQRRILDHLDEVTAEHGTAVLFITHDLGVAQERADRLIVMRRGEIVEQGATGSILNDPQHPYTRQLIAAAPSLSSAKLSPNTAAVRHRQPAAEETASARPVPAAEVIGIVKSFPVHHRGSGARAKPAVGGVSFTIPAGGTYALVGESGSGKTTVSRVLLRLTDPDAGRVLIAGRDVTRLRGAQLRELRRSVQVVYQNPYASLDPRLIVQDLISEPLRNFGIGTGVERMATVRGLLDQVALPATVLQRPPAELSGGQRQRVAIARSLALQPQLLVLDEPVSALDVSVQAQILQLLADLQAELGLSYLFISHDLAVVRQISDSVGVLRSGVLVESGPSTTVLTNPEHQYTQELLDAIPGGRRRR